MKAAVVSSALVARTGSLSPRRYLGDTSEQDEIIRRAEEAIEAAKRRIAKAQAEKDAILAEHKRFVESGEVKVLA